MKLFSVKYHLVLASVALAVILMACDKENYPVPVETYPTNFGDQSFTQGFTSLANAQTQGWIFRNLSDNAATGWTSVVKGTTPYTTSINPMTAGNNFLYSSYAASNDVKGNISNWAISPKLIIQNGDQITFYTISSGTADGYGDRLQLRMNIFNTDDATGSTSSDVGQFTNPLLDINYTYSITSTDPNSYPTTWTKYVATVKGLNHPDSGRVALRYFVELNGGANGDAMALDSFSYKSAAH